MAESVTRQPDSPPVFTPRADCKYLHDYVGVEQDIKGWGEASRIPAYRELVKKDLFFLLYFVMGRADANHPFVVQACKDVQFGADDWVMDWWARGHFKSSIITEARTIQMVLTNPEERIGIFSHTRPAAKAFLRGIKTIFEQNQSLKTLFPDVLYQDPAREAPKWSEDEGICLKRKGVYIEQTIEAWGMVEGMPTGKHYTYRIYDDIETRDMVQTPEMVEKVKGSFKISQYLKARDGKHRVIGTPYSHAGALQYIRELKDADGKPLYNIRFKPVTVDGTVNGRPVLLSDEEVNRLKAPDLLQDFYSQYLLDPTPLGVRTMEPSMLQEIEDEFIPRDAYRFMVIDPAGTEGGGDAWAILTVAVEPVVDSIGQSRVFIADAFIEPAAHAAVIEQICRMYIRGGMILKVGVEKVGQSSVEIHVAQALRQRGRHISEDNGSLVILKPAGRDKRSRIENAISWPLNNGKLFISKKIPAAYRERLLQEMAKFPYWHDDGLDALSYVYDMLKDYRFDGSNVSYKPPVQTEYGVI